jgi:DNA-binding transcriptional MerR regulator
MAVTIAEISVECGVSEQAIRAWCRRNHVAKDAKGSFAITETQKTAIYQHYLGIDRKEVSQPAKASCETCETSETALITMLERELDRKSEQLAVKDKQIAELNERLSECSAALLAAQQTTQAAQVLHAGTIQKEIASGESGVDKQKSASEKKNRWFKRLFRG